MFNKTILIALMLFTAPLFSQAQSDDEPIVIVEEEPDFYNDCLKDESLYDDSAKLVYVANCKSSFYFNSDDMGDSPDPIIKDVVLQSNRIMCNNALYGAQMLYLPDFNSSDKDKRLWMLVTDALPELGQDSTGVAELIITPNMTGQFIVGAKTERGNRRLDCTLKKM